MPARLWFQEKSRIENGSFTKIYKIKRKNLEGKIEACLEIIVEIENDDKRIKFFQRVRSVTEIRIIPILAKLRKFIWCTYLLKSS